MILLSSKEFDRENGSAQRALMVVKAAEFGRNDEPLAGLLGVLQPV